MPKIKPASTAQRSLNASRDFISGRIRKLSTERSPVRTSTFPVMPGKTCSDLLPCFKVERSLRTSTR